MSGAFPTIASADFSPQCPITGEICAAREKLIRLYTENVDPTIRASLPGVLAMREATDQVKLGIKLGEMTAQAQLRGCEGMTEEVCPVREAMNESASRQTMVGAIRKLIHRGN